MPEKIKGGYYIKARRIRESWVAMAPPVVREVWDYLLREANHKPRRVGGYTIERGQLLKTGNEIRDALAWKVGYRTERYSENQMKLSMKVLYENQMIQRTKTPMGTLITIPNYSYYQDPKNYEATNEATDPQPTKPPTKQPTPNNPYNKNEKKERKKKKTTPPPKKSGEAEAKLEKFWDAYPRGSKQYPRRIGKAKCRDWFESHNPSEQVVAQMCAALAGFAQSEQWREPRYIPHPITFLNQRRWEDYDPEVSAQSNAAEYERRQATPPDEEDVPVFQDLYRNWEVADLFDTILEYVSERIRLEEYESWFACLRIDENKIVCPDDLHRNWLNSHYRELFEEAVEAAKERVKSEIPF